MSRIDKLIEELCSDGVEWKELGDICENIISGKNKQRIETGEFPVYGSTGIIGHTDDYVFDKECLLIARVGANAGFVHIGKGKYDVSDNTLIVRPKAIYNLSFGYYQLSFLGINKLAKGGGQPLITAGDIKKIQIPIPPLPIQQEIVNILDKFTALDAELQAELEARKKQYEYYRNQLLDFEGTEVEWKTLEEVSRFCFSGGTPSTNRRDFYGGTIPWLRTQEINWKDIYDTGIKITESGLNNSTAKWIKANCVIVAMYGATAAKVAINKIPLTTNQACCNLEIDDKYANYRYVYHWICREYVNLKSLGEGVQSNINSQKIKNYKIPIPPLAEQERIVSIIDKFEEIVNSGLPAEIEARRKQYEYYRERLLTFNKAE